MDLSKREREVLAAYKEQQQAVGEMLDSNGWRVVLKAVEELLRQAVQVTGQEVEGYKLYRAQGWQEVLPKLVNEMNDLASATEEELLMRMQREEANG